MRLCATTFRLPRRAGGPAAYIAAGVGVAAGPPPSRSRRLRQAVPRLQQAAAEAGVALDADPHGAGEAEPTRQPVLRQSAAVVVAQRERTLQSQPRPPPQHPARL